MPRGSDPKKILTDAMNPGLGVRELHQRGITGKGVNVAIIDQPLYMDHPEYAGKFVAYHDTGCGESKNSMHGPGMASLLVGNQCGTAPGARVYYGAVPSWKMDATYYADALDWVVRQNEVLPVSKKIRVVSVSAQPSGTGSKYINQSLWDQAVQRAEASGILVLDCTWNHGIVSVCWLDPQDRENVESCTPGFRRDAVEVDEGHIHVPSAPRTTAQAYSERGFGYTYDGGGSRSGRPMSKGGYSDSIPYAAGILAMGWQIRPELHHQQMRELLFKSAFTKSNGAKIINPKKFIRLVRRTKSTPTIGNNLSASEKSTTGSAFSKQITLKVLPEDPRFADKDKKPDKAQIARLRARSRESRLLEELGNAAVAWLKEGKQSSILEVNKLIDSLLAESNLSVGAYFAAAKIANLCGQSEKAILILENVASKHGDADAPGSMIEPVDLMAYYWIGSIARHSGDGQRASRAYETIIEKSKKWEGLNQERYAINLMHCNMYLAEIASDNLKDNTLALKRLDEVEKAIESVEKDHKPYEVKFFQDWAKYKASVIRNGKSQARQQLAAKDSNKVLSTAFMTAVVQLSLTHLGGKTDPSLFDGKPENGEFLGEALKRLVTESTKSPIDKRLAKFFTGTLELERKKFTEAEKHFSELFEEDSYFSPMAGIALAHCKKEQGKNAEAADVLKQVKNKYPGYKLAVDLQKEP